MSWGEGIIISKPCWVMVVCQSPSVTTALQDVVKTSNMLAMEKLEGGDYRACLELLTR